MVRFDAAGIRGTRGSSIAALSSRLQQPETATGFGYGALGAPFDGQVCHLLIRVSPSVEP